MKIFAYSLLSTEKMDSGSAISNMDTGRINSFIKAVDPHRLAMLEIKQFSPSNKKVMSDAKYLDNADRLARVYGADESTERVALFLFEKNYYYLWFTLLRYGETWKIAAQVSPIAGTNGLGVPQKTTVDEFGRMTNNN